MNELRTLLSIFQTESDDAEIRRKKANWITVITCKDTAWQWSELNDPIWSVKRKPRVWNMILVEDTILIDPLMETRGRSFRPIRVREVIEGEE